MTEPHYYFRVSSPEVSSEDVPIFSTKRRTLFIQEPSQNRGIHCRFGMAGIIAEAHYDGSRNMVAELGGRYRGGTGVSFVKL